MVFLLVLDPLLHTPCISSPSHHLLFAAHAHTNAACSAVIPMLLVVEVVIVITCVADVAVAGDLVGASV